METETTTTNETKPTWQGEPFARFPVLWKEGGAWRLRVIRQQSQCGSPCWEDTGLMLRNDQVDGMAKVLRAETEAHGEDAVAIAIKKKIPARPVRAQVEGPKMAERRTATGVAAEVRSCAEIMAKKPRLDRVAPVVTLDERKRRQIEAGRKAAETRRRRLAEQQAAQAGA
jgi:hypothetical protein